MASSSSSSIALHCRKCHSAIVGASHLKLTLSGSAGFHLKLRADAGPEIENSIEKVQNPDPRKRARTPFKALCIGQETCRSSVGAYTSSELCFSASSVYFHSRFQDYKWKKWSDAKEQLQTMGIFVETVSPISKDCVLPTSSSKVKKESLPLVYCDVTLTSDNTIDLLTCDKPRDYQRELFRNAMKDNSVVYLPTGCGKTLVAAMAIACMNHLNPRKVAVFLAPKIPLVHQQCTYLKRQLPRIRIQSLAGDSGSDPGDKTPWIQLINSLIREKVDVLVLTPQIFLNFLEDERHFLRMSDLSLIVLDEAHHCQGNHPYAKIMESFYTHVPDKCKPLILALTASPTSALEVEKIESECLKLMETLDCTMAIPRSGSSDFGAHWNRPNVSYLLKELNIFEKCLETNLESYLKSLNALLTRLLGTSGLESLAIQSSNYKGILRNAINDSQNKKEQICGHALAEHAMSILSTFEVNSVVGCDQACGSLINMFLSIEEASNPMDSLRQNILSDLPCYNSMTSKVKRLHDLLDKRMARSDRFQELETELRGFAVKVRQGDEDCRGIVFVKMRKTCSKLCDELNKDPLIRDYLKPKKFFGHGKGTFGMEWKEEQETVLSEFHSGECKLLISTSVLEEGLDVPACNLVIRFDSVMSMRAFVQSRGRAARRPDSRYLIMCNDSNEMTKFQEMETKERNIEDAISTFGLIRRDLADVRGCEIRKLDAKHIIVTKASPGNRISWKTSYFKSDEKKKRRKKPPPRVSVSLNIETQKGTTKPSSSAVRITSQAGSRTNPEPRQAPEIPIRAMSATETKTLKLFEKHFHVRSYETDIPAGTRSVGSLNDLHTTYGKAFYHLEAQHEHSFRNKDEFFDDVVRVWCEEGFYGSWLERDDRKTHARKMVFHILPIESFAGGDFKDRGTFSELWEHECPLGAEIVFLHDLKMVVIVFFSSSNVLHKIEFRYDQLHDFILLDVPQCTEESANMFLCLRHVPLLSAAQSSFLPFSKGSEECSFTQYFLSGENQEESSDHESPENDEFFHSNDLNVSEESVDDSSEEETTELQCLEHSADDETDLGSNEFPFENGLHPNTYHEETPPVESKSLSFFAEEMTAIEDMVWVKQWRRRCEIDENVSPFGSFLAFRIRVPYSLDLRDALGVLTTFGKRIFYAPVKVENQSSELRRATFLPSEVRYAHDCLVGLHPNVRPRLSPSFYDLLASSTPTDSANAVYQISSSLVQDYFTDPEVELRALMAGHQVKRGHISKSSVPTNCALIKRLVLTPTRVIPFPPEVMEQNRVLRSFDSDQFLCVNVREEDYSRLRGYKATLDEVLERIKGFMDGGMQVGGLLYEFLGCSNSQMRSHGCWFVHPTCRDNAYSIRLWMGDLSQIRCVASYMSRLGQCFSSSLDAIGITLEDGVTWRKVDDVKLDDYCFSDGIGRISPKLSKEVCVKVGKPGCTSALQIRFAGCKGVLCQDPRLPENCVDIRPSMHKFESPHRRLEVLQTSRPQAVYLNHQTIMLLSNLGVPDEIFLDLQQKMLDGLAEMMLNEDEALQRMSSMVRNGINYKTLADNGVSLTTEPYFKSLLCAVYKEQINRLLKKSRILLPVSKARLMMGVMDETGSLEYGQVFVQCTYMTSEGNSSDEDEEELLRENRRFIVNQRVIVTRNPCLHPGDVRELEAVDVPELHHLIDCVVFPRKGPRPHPNEMAGGDLDGDLYFVSWFDSFKLSRKPSNPMDYPTLTKEIKDGPITVSDMTNFFTTYIEFDQLGIIDNAHKVWADKREDGVESEVCLRLAELHSLAVDAPKTGKWPELQREDKPREYPDFMMKAFEPSYVSQKVIGKLFRECRDFEETMKHMLPISGVQVDRRFILPGYHTYLESAATTYQEYASQVETLMNLYGIKSEGEVMSGCFHKLKGEFGRERSQIAGVVRKMLLQVRTNFRALFFKEFQKEGERLTPQQITLSMQQKASAWYYYAYKANLDPPLESKSDGKTSLQFVSFPWVVDDILVTVLSDAGQLGKIQPPLNNYVTRNVAQSVLELFVNDAPMLVSDYKARMELLDVVSRRVNLHHRSRRLVMFGSSANLLFRPDSDLDLCVLAPSRVESRSQASQVETLQSLEAILGKAFGDVKLIKNARVPVIRLGKLKSPRASSPGIKLSCDITADWNGFIKTTVIVSYFRHYPWLLPLLRLVILWAHSAGLTKKVESVRINTNVLVFMLLSYCVQAGHISPFSLEGMLEEFRDITRCQNVSVEFWERIITAMKNERDCEDSVGALSTTVSHVGCISLDFYKNRKRILYGPIPESFHQLLNATTFSELLNPGDIQILLEQMQKAYHVLAIHGNGHILLDISSSQVQRTFVLSKIQTLVIEGSERSHSRDLSKKSGAEVTIRPQLPGNDRGLILEACGTIGSIRVLEGILSSQKNEYSRNKLSAMSKCFVRGSSMITFEGCHSDDDYITLVPYWGNHHQTHDQRIRHVPLLQSPRVSSTPSDESHAFQSFRNKFLDQIKVVSRDYDPTIHGVLEFVVHFGRIYAFDIPHALSEDSEPITIKDLQYSSDKGRNTRVNHMPFLQVRFRKPGGRGTAKVKSVPRQKTKETKREEDKSVNHSLFTIVPSECLRDIHDYLERKGYNEQPESGIETYTATVRLGSKDFYVSYDSDLCPTSFTLPRLRWFLADVKRRWKSRGMSPGTATLDGCECDVRLMLGTSREFTLDEVRAGDYEKYMSILEPNPTPFFPRNSRRHPFKIREELRKNLQLVRQKEKVMFHRPQCQTNVYLNKVTEYSRLNSSGEFRKVFHRHELVIRPGLPASWENADEVDRFLKKTWKLAFRLAKKASR